MNISLMKQKLNLNKKSVVINSIIYFSTLISITVLLGSLIYFFSIKSYFLNEITSNNEQILKQTAAAYEVFLDNMVKSSIVYMESESLNPNTLISRDSFEDNSLIYNRLNNIAQISNFVYSIYYFNRNPQNIYINSGFSFDFNDFYDRDWIESLDNKRDFYILPARKLPTLMLGEKDVIPVVINLPLNSENHLYTYVINLDANQLFKYIIKNIDQSTVRDFKIIDSSGIVIISSDDPSSIFKSIEEFPYMKQKLISDSDEGSFQALKGDERVFVSFYTSLNYGWKYISEVNFDTISQNMLRPLKIILLISLLLICFSVLAAVTVSRKLYKPFRDLIYAVGAGDGELKDENEYEVISKHVNKYLTENKHLQLEVNNSKPALKKQFLYNLTVRNIYSVEDAIEQLHYFNIPVNHNYIVMLIEIDDFDRYVNTFKLDDRMLWEFAIENIALEFISQKGTGFFIGIESSRFALVFSFSEYVTKEEREKTTTLLAHDIKEAIRSFLKFSVTIGIGSSTEDLSSLYKSYQEAVAALKYKETTGNDEIILFSEVSIANAIQIAYPYEMEKALIQYIMMGDTDKSKMIVEGMFEIYKKQKYLHKSQLQVFSFQLLNTIMKLIMELGISEEEVFLENQDFSALSGRFTQIKHEDECIFIFSSIIENLCKYVRDKRENTSNSQVRLILDYINENYSKQISMDLIADYIGLNRSYAGRLFKQYVNVSVVDYINQVRINKAVDLLNNSDMKVHEIATEVGFNNTHYFIKIFKKVMNITPGQYKEQTGKDMD